MANLIHAGTLEERPAGSRDEAFFVVHPDPSIQGLYVHDGVEWVNALPHEPLAFAPPPLDPQFTYTVTVADGTSFYSVPADVDVIVKWPAGPVTNRVELSGAFRHLVSIGGETNQSVSNPTESSGRGIIVEGGSRNDGIVHIEGHYFHGSSLTDGIYFSHPSNLQVLACAFEDVGKSISDPIGSGIHPDAIQVVQGNSLRVDRCSIDTYYQGITSSLSYGGMAKTDIRRVDIVGYNPTGWSSGTTWLIGAYGAHNFEVPVWLRDVYLTPSPFSQTLAASVSMQASGGQTATANPDGSISWAPGMNVYGRVQQGPPPGGRYVRGSSTRSGIAVPGLGYVTPGYKPSDDRRPHPNIWTPNFQRVAASSLDDPITAVADAITFTSGTPRVARVPINRAVYCQAVDIYVSTAATNLTASQCYIAIFDAAGRQIGKSSDLSGSLASTGKFSVALNTKAAIVGMEGSHVWVYILLNGSGLPKLYGVDHVMVNDGLDAPFYRAGTVGSSITAVPSTFAVSLSAGTSGITADTKLPLVVLTD